MGTTTPNMNIYKPANGERNYGDSFNEGLDNIDDHDHSGPPKGVPLSSAGLAPGSITRDKLNANVFGIGVQPDANNAIEVAGVLKPIFQLASNGLIARTSGTTASARTITGTTNQVIVTNGDGVGGDPTISLNSSSSITWTPVVQGSAVAGVGTYSIQAGRYVRLGAFLSVTGQLVWTNHTGSGDIIISGFPVAFAAALTVYISTLGFASITMPAGTIQVALDGNNNDTTANVVGYQSAGAAQNVQLGTSGTLNFTLIYYVA